MDDRPSVVDHDWSATECQLSVIDHYSATINGGGRHLMIGRGCSTISNRPSMVDHWWPATECQLVSIFDHQWSTVSGRSSMVGHWMSTITSRPSVVNHQWSTIDDGPLPVHFRKATIDAIESILNSSWINFASIVGSVREACKTLF